MATEASDETVELVAAATQRAPRDALTTWAEMAKLLDDLPVIVRAARRTARLSLRELAAKTGLSFATIARVEEGRELSSVTLRALLLWLDNPEGLERV